MMKRRLLAVAATVALGAAAFLGLSATSALASDASTSPASVLSVAVSGSIAVPPEVALVAESVPSDGNTPAVTDGSVHNKDVRNKESVASGAADAPGPLLLVVGLGAILASIVLVVRANARRGVRSF